MFKVLFLVKCYRKKLQNRNGTLSKTQVASVVSESSKAYASIALVVVWISVCFTMSLSRKLH